VAMAGCVDELAEILVFCQQNSRLAKGEIDDGVSVAP
jgi:hypothetical protein